MSTLRSVIARLRSDMLTKGEIALERPEIITASRCALKLIMGIIFSGANIFGNYAPFGIAVVAISGAGVEGICALVGASIGYLLRMGFIGGLKYISACVLVYAAAYVFHDIKAYKKDWFMPLIASFMSMCTGFVYAADTGWSIATTVFFLTETILVAGSTYFYKIALSARIIDADNETEEIKTAVSLLLLEATCLISLSGITVLEDISIGRMLAQLTVMLISFKVTMGVGCAAGVALGLAMDSCSGMGAPFYSMAYGFSGLLSGVFGRGRNGRFMFTLVFILSNCVSVLWTWQSVLQISILYETFIVSVIFMMLPSNVLGKVSLGLGDNEGFSGALNAREYSREKIEALSEAFKELYRAGKAGQTTNNVSDVATIFDRAADKSCRSCVMKTKCWHINYESTLDAINNATKNMMERGSLQIQDMPGYFTEACIGLESFIAAANEELRAFIYRRQFNARLQESRETTTRQYLDMSDILNGVAAEMGASLTFDPYAERKLQKYLKTVGIEAQSAVYKDKNGRLRAELKGDNLGAVIKDEEYLDKLSAVLETRLCEKKAEDMREMMFIEAEPLAAAVGIASVRKKGESVSGDKGTYFKTDEGILYVILSDGMGSGDEAAKESESTINILERFLMAGLNPENVLKILGSAISAKNDLNTGYATVDLLGVNLFTGESKIFKCGAAPSYVKKGKLVKTIKGENPGFLDKDTLVPDEINLKLEPGHFAIIASDGVSVEGDDQWLKTKISEYRDTEPKELAKNILEEAIKLYGCEDDMTVLAIYLEERS